MLTLAVPYGNAPSWCFLFTELSVFVLTIGCLIHAWKRRNGALAYLLGGIIFGSLVEYLEVLSGSYTYGRFWLMLGHAPLDIPLFVGCAWAIILYTARLFSDAAGLPVFAAAALDALLALNLDMSMDTVAYRMHFWNWDWSGTGRNPLTADWFGIPYGNFVGWITVVFSYSIISRLLEPRLLCERRTAIRVWSIPALTTILSLGVLFSSEMFLFPSLNHLGVKSEPRLVILTVLLLVVTLRGWSKYRPLAKEMHPLARWVPAWFHFFFVYCFFAIGIYRENKWMTIAACLNFLIGIAVHCAPVGSRLGSPEPLADNPSATAFNALDAQPSLRCKMTVL
jgi:uncharacterized membrane protein